MKGRGFESMDLPRAGCRLDASKRLAWHFVNVLHLDRDEAVRRLRPSTDLGRLNFAQWISRLPHELMVRAYKLSPCIATVKRRAPGPM